jgi:hypothetical protein
VSGPRQAQKRGQTQPTHNRHTTTCTPGGPAVSPGRQVPLALRQCPWGLLSPPARPARRATGDHGHGPQDRQARLQQAQTRQALGGSRRPVLRTAVSPAGREAFAPSRASPWLSPTAGALITGDSPSLQRTSHGPKACQLPPCVHGSAQIDTTPAELPASHLELSYPEPIRISNPSQGRPSWRRFLDSCPGPRDKRGWTCERVPASAGLKTGGIQWMGCIPSPSTSGLTIVLYRVYRHGLPHRLSATPGVSAMITSRLRHEPAHPSSPVQPLRLLRVGVPRTTRAVLWTLTMARHLVPCHARVRT